MWMKRPMTSNTLLACTVVNTRCPVSADCTAICAVSASRISPTMILSGSWRRIERKPRAKVRPFFSLTGICSTPGSWYSTGSSMVMILSWPWLISVIAAYSVVVLPDLVGQRLLVENAQHRVFAEYARHDRHAEVHLAAVHRHLEAAVLRHPALGDGVEAVEQRDRSEGLLRLHAGVGRCALDHGRRE